MKDKIDGFIDWVKDNKTETWCIFAIMLGAATLICLHPEFFAGMIVGAVAGWNKDWIIRKAKGL